MNLTAITRFVESHPPAAREAFGLDRTALASSPLAVPAAETGVSALVVELATHRVNDPAFRAIWLDLVMAGDSPQKIYQTPQFFSLLQQLPKDSGTRLEVLAVLRLSDAAIVGVIPVRIMQYDLDFVAGPLKLYTAQLEMIGLLGSVTAAPGGAGMEYLASQMLELFPSAYAIHMQALPAASRQWNAIASFAGSGQLATTLMGPWRDCHTMPLPATFDQYLAKFSSKKRYNLNRQIRQLAERAGPLALIRIERADQVPDMMGAIKALGTAAEVAGTLSLATFTGMAEHDLLLCYALYAGDEPVGVLVGTRSPDALHIHKIFVDKKYMAISIGTSVMHLALEDLTAMKCFTRIDFGYGEPQGDFRTSHELETRAPVLLFDRMRSVSALFYFHGIFNRTTEAMLDAIKWLRSATRSLRKAKIA